MASLNISDVNKMSSDRFQWTFGNVIELCPDAATNVFKKIPCESVVDLCEAFSDYLDHLDVEGKLVVLRKHPDLAGRLALQGELTPESTGEQQSAGLNDMTEEERHTINTYNQRYKEKFGFPFIICARENKVQSIIEGLRQRYNNTQEQEIDIGIGEVKKICKLRILDIVKD